MISRLIYGIYYIILCACTYTFFHNDRIVSVRKTSYLNLESEAYLRRRKIYTWHRIYIYIKETKCTRDIEYIYKRRNIHISDIEYTYIRVEISFLK